MRRAIYGLLALICAASALVCGALGILGLKAIFDDYRNHVINAWAGEGLLFGLCLVPAAILARCAIVAGRRAVAQGVPTP